MAAMRLGRHAHHPSSLRGHSPTDPSYSQSSKRHSHDLGYSTNDYPASIWHTQNMNNPQQQQPQSMHSQTKHNQAPNENPLLKLNELSRYSSARTNERNSR